MGWHIATGTVASVRFVVRVQAVRWKLRLNAREAPLGLILSSAHALAFGALICFPSLQNGKLLSCRDVNCCDDVQPDAGTCPQD